ncbi:NAD-dependent epimerase/dehydratase family protein [Nonomuraea roseoviolacea subsp. roseoviolacea]|uniref:Nucleoside-diphosphate-sugar epimerase n=1 Tax=Nonomuraea roseoviolacea subsp. carminata TaxID=160689 RepID=A0ABT1K2J3_9ACTN|nr:NAD-dependent epimerase/dehydratase family protein [Nonomuraea roseoviolacea]MCP2348208.1 nucleoside-diphosphate-sugar epimerase [Nonomuraea roseoviolacea subsp. carminata]
MRILIVGARGYLGSAVSERLSAAGHQVVALVRSADPEGRYEQRIGDLTDPASLTAAVTPDIDAVINLATPTGDADTDAAAVTALTAPLRGTGRAFVYTSGVWVLGATGSATADEETPTDPIAIVGYRPGIERQVLDTAEDGVRATVLRPGIVYGRGGGIPALLVGLARRNSAPTVVEDPAVRWPMVHVDDLADLFAKVVEQAPAGTLWHGVSEPAVPVRELAVAAAQAAGVAGEPKVWPLEEARKELGELFADALALDQSVGGEAARDRLGWEPRHPEAAADLREGSYR